MLFNENISLDNIVRLEQTYNLDDLIQGRTDAVTAYLTNEPWHMEQLGIQPHIIRPSTYGVDFYSDCLFTTDQELEAEPKRVKSFLTASLEGWAYAMAHPDEIIELIIHSYNVKKSREHLKYEANAIQGIMFPDLVEIGHMNPGRWRHIADTYASLEMLQPDYPLDAFLYNPDPHPDYGWMKWTILILVAFTLTFRSLPHFSSISIKNCNRRYLFENDDHGKSQPMDFWPLKNVLLFQFDTNILRLEYKRIYATVQKKATSDNRRQPFLYPIQ